MSGESSRWLAPPTSPHSRELAGVFSCRRRCNCCTYGFLGFSPPIVFSPTSPLFRHLRRPTSTPCCFADDDTPPAVFTENDRAIRSDDTDGFNYLLHGLGGSGDDDNGRTLTRRRRSCSRR